MVKAYFILTSCSKDFTYKLPLSTLIPDRLKYFVLYNSLFPHTIKINLHLQIHMLNYAVVFQVFFLGLWITFYFVFLFCITTCLTQPISQFEELVVLTYETSLSCTNTFLYIHTYPNFELLFKIIAILPEHFIGYTPWTWILTTFCVCKTNSFLHLLCFLLISKRNSYCILLIGAFFDLIFNSFNRNILLPKIFLDSFSNC